MGRTNPATADRRWLEVEDDGRWPEVLAWGVFTDKIVAHAGFSVSVTPLAVARSSLRV